MGDRRNFIRNVAMGIAVSLLPKILRPMNAEIETEQEVVSEKPKAISVAVYHVHNFGDSYTPNTFYNRETVEGKNNHSS